ncbi:MAG: thioredoxin domain-containing protein [Chloroflexota bacterium]
MGVESTDRHTNRLAAETSPYLLQHAHNPVDWYPWGEEALGRAKAEDRPIFLSIGYAACHWCHVMERESFENEATAALLNAGFVPIKVDREERPDLDAIYMDAVQQMTGGGGWPMSVFLTPDGKPFYGGTYFPDTARHGLPAFRDVLEGVSEAWRERRTEVEQAAAGLAQAITPVAHAHEGAAELPPRVLDEALAQVEAGFDARTGGWGGAPKFPQAMTIEFLLRLHVSRGDAAARPLAIARRSLDAMGAGGIYDQLGGGFARYATDRIWLVPHFEKMLYDNAQLARAYVHAWQLTRDPNYRRVAEETLAFVERDMLTMDGGFTASLDADTAGEEGATYVWSRAEIDTLLGDDAQEFSRVYGVTAEGNWEGHNILSRVAEGDEDRLRPLRDQLFAVRQKRPQPARDDKVLTAWNGLMIGAFADAAATFDEPRYAEVAARAADLLLTRVRDESGRLRRSWKDGRALHAGTLEDYTHLADGLLALYQATFDERWFVGARELMDMVLEHFEDPSGGFFDTADDHEALITRPKGLQDNAIPSGGAMVAEVLIRLAAFTGEGRYRTAAEKALASVAPYLGRYPTGFAQWLGAYALAVGDLVEIAIAADNPAADAHPLLAVVRATYRPFSVIAAGRDGAVPLLADRPLRDGKATAYVCRNFACRAPVTDGADLAAQLTSAT